MPIRVFIMQPALPKYRVPVFRELAQRPGLTVTVSRGDEPHVPSVEPDGFAAFESKHHRIRLAGVMGIEWHAPSASDLKGADVLVLPWNLRLLSHPVTILRARMRGIPVVLWGHGYSKHDAPIKTRLRQWMGLLGDAVVLYNRGTADALVLSGVPRARTFVALNTVDIRPISAQIAAWRNKQAELEAFAAREWLPGGPRLLLVSRLLDQNRIDRLIATVAALKGKHPGIRAVLIGKGPAEGKLKEMAAAAGVADRVVFNGAIYDESELAPYFLTAEQFVYPENVGLSLNHAMAYGVPVVTSDRTDAQNPEIEAMRHEYNGLVYQHGSTEAMTRTIERLAVDVALRRRLAEAASATIHGRYSIPRMVDGLEAAIRYALALRRGVSSEFGVRAEGSTAGDVATAGVGTRAASGG